MEKNQIKTHAPPMKTGGRPPHQHLKFILHDIMRQLKVADVNRVKQAYIRQTGKQANYHTLKKYLDQLTEDDILQRQLISDNVPLVHTGQRQQRRQLYLYYLK